MSRKDINDELVCKAYAEREMFDNRWPYDYLQEWTGEPFKVCYRAMERAADRDLIDYGVSLRSGWLTERGKKLLKEVKSPCGKT